MHYMLWQQEFKICAFIVTIVISVLFRYACSATNFDVLLTVHLSIILATDQLNSQILVL